MLIFYHFANVARWGVYNAYQPKVDDLHFYKPFPKLLKYYQICFKTQDLGWEFEYAKKN